MLTIYFKLEILQICLILDLVLFYLKRCNEKRLLPIAIILLFLDFTFIFVLYWIEDPSGNKKVLTNKKYLHIHSNYV